MSRFNRREHERYFINEKTIIKTGEKKYNVSIQDLGVGGVRLHASEPITCTITMSLSIKKNLVCPIRYERHHLKSNIYIYVFRFKSLDDPIQKKLEHYLQSFTHHKIDRRDKYPFLLKCFQMMQFQHPIDTDTFPYLKKIDSGAYSHIMTNGKQKLNLGSNNYLGLSTHPEVVEAGIKAAEKYGIGSGGSRFVTGNIDLHQDLETKLATFKNAQACVIYSTGYMTNTGVISLLASQKEDCLLIDSKCHASIIEGCRLSGAKVMIFHHNNIAHLKEKLEKTDHFSSRLIITEGVFSMDGDIAKLDAIYELAEAHQVPIMSDEAHATGVIGPQGKGTTSHFGLDGKIAIQTGTLSKALGGMGGFVVGNQQIVHSLKHYSRSFMFTTSLPPIISASVLKALEIMEQEPQWYQQLQHNIAFMKKSLEEANFQTGLIESAIIIIKIGNETIAHAATQALEERGIFVTCAVYPIVRKREAVLRITLMATHTQQELSFFVETLKQIKHILSF